LPLLTGRIEVNSIQLSGLTLNLETNTKGDGNWLMESGASPNGTAASSPTSAVPADAKKSASDTDTTDRNLVLIENLNLVNGQIHYQPSGAAVSSYGVSRLSMQKNGAETAINADLQQNAFTLAIKGKITSVREVLRSMAQRQLTSTSILKWRWVAGQRNSREKRRLIQASLVSLIFLLKRTSSICRLYQRSTRRHHL
jgi:uncharacterized protein involved in outer membrane biogenesis